MADVTIREALLAKYQLPHWLLLFEVRDATGFSSSRSADAIAVGMYRSRGYEVLGFEIKEARSDFLRELKDPAKAEKIGRFCDYFFLVTNAADIARPDELPAPWGLLVLKGSRFKREKKPERLHPEPINRPMLASLLYGAIGRVKGELEHLIDDKVKERREIEQGRLEFEAKHQRERADGNQRMIDEFEKAAGVCIRWGDRAKIGAAVRAVLDGDERLKRHREELTHLVARSQGLARVVAEELERLDADAALVTAAGAAPSAPARSSPPARP